MFTIKSENQNVISQLILSEATLGIFGVAVLVVMLAFAFVGTASETNMQQSVKAKQSKPIAPSFVAKNARLVEKQNGDDRSN